MGSKKSLITLAIIVVVLVGGAILWKGGFLWGGVGTTSNSTSPTGGITPATQPGTGGQTGGQTTGGSIGKMTDDIYVEILVQSAYNAQKDPTSWASSGYNSLLSKYGVTEENVIAYGEELGKNPQRAQEVATKYMKRLTELQSTGK